MPQGALGLALAPLRHRPFARFWSGAFVSNVGTWMETVAVGILVTEVTGQAAWVGLVAAAAFAPGAVLGPVGGALADRYPRKLILLGTSSAQMVMAAGLCALAVGGDPSPVLVTLAMLGTGCANALGFPSYQAVLPDLVPRDQVVAAVGLSSAQWNLGRVIGPALAGLVVSTGGPRWGYASAFGINALSFLAVIAVVASLRLPPPPAAGSVPIARSIGQGFGFAWREPGLRAVVAFMALNSLLAAPFIALVAPMALQVLDAGEVGVAALVTAQGLGAVVMAVSLGAVVVRVGSRRMLEATLWLLPLALAGYAGAPTLVLAVPAIAVVGALYLGALSSFTSIAQLRSPPEVRGRVLSVLNVLLATLYPMGSVVQGRLADHLGLRVVTAGGAGAMLAVMVVVRRVSPGFLRPLDPPVGPPVAER